MPGFPDSVLDSNLVIIIKTPTHLVLGSGLVPKELPAKFRV